MFDKNQINELKTAVSESSSFAILLPPEPSTDQVAAALGLTLALEKAGKQVQIASGSPIKVENAEFFGVNKIKTSIGNQNLIISFDFKEENLKKVDYDLDENGRFQLLIQPQPGTPPPDVNNIEYSYSGASADLVFVFGINSLEELGKIYADEKNFLDKAKIISLNSTNKPSTFASLSFHSNTVTCASEIAAFILKNLDMNPTADGANNLLQTINTNSNQFSSPKVTADTFELIAFLMRNGGSLARSPLSTSSRFGAFAPPAFPTSPFSPPPFAPTFDDDFSPPPANPIRRGAPADWKKPKVFNRPSSDTSSR